MSGLTPAAEARSGLITAVQEESQADLILYNGLINYHGFRSVLKIASARDRAPNVILFLTTFGGDPHAAFRIARCLQKQYQRFVIAIAGFCKSAGTMVALGASEIVMDGGGELGPLDVQLRKRDEMVESESGLDVTQALVQLTEESLSAFQTTLVDITTGAGISTKASAEIATKLITGLYGHIFSQIDPVRLGSVVRANRIGMHYGSELGRNLKPGALPKLVNWYPSHGCVIDREEASKLFQKVREFTDAEVRLLESIGTDIADPYLQSEVPRVTKITPPDAEGDTDDKVEKLEESKQKQLEPKSSKRKRKLPSTTGPRHHRKERV